MAVVARIMHLPSEARRFTPSTRLPCNTHLPTDRIGGARPSDRGAETPYASAKELWLNLGDGADESSGGGIGRRAALVGSLLDAVPEPYP
jgi:hypothetical protein